MINTKELREQLIESYIVKAKGIYKGLTKAQYRKVAIMLIVDEHSREDFSRGKTPLEDGKLYSFGLNCGCGKNKEGQILITLNTKMTETLKDKGIINIISVGKSFADVVELIK